jgi:hypothetical protein
MRARGTACGATIAAAAVLATGCGSGAASLAKQASTPKAGTAVSSSAPSTLSGTELRYPHQINAAAYFKKPCTTLTEPQIDRLIGARPGDGHRIDVGGTGQGCNWEPASLDTPANSIAISWLRKGQGGLKFLYSIRNERKHFQPTTVAGFPAVNTSGHAEKSSGECVINVGVNDQRYFFAQFQTGALAPKGLDLCGKARQAARYVIKNLKGGS